MNTPLQNPFPGDVGPLPTPEGILYRVWAFCHKKVVAHIEKPDGETYTIELEAAPDGYFFGLDRKGAPGDLYMFSLDGAAPIPDFASHFQPRGVNGPSMVVNADCVFVEGDGLEAARLQRAGDLRMPHRHPHAGRDLSGRDPEAGSSGRAGRDRGGVHAGGRLGGQTGLGLRRRAALRAVPRLRHAGRFPRR